MRERSYQYQNGEKIAKSEWMNKYATLSKINKNPRIWIQIFRVRRTKTKTLQKTSDLSMGFLLKLSDLENIKSDRF